MAVDILLSYAFHPNVDLDRVREDIGPGSIMIDSGAFSVYMAGRTITLDEYARFLRRWEGVYDYAVTLDVIGDAEATRRNLAELQDRGFDVLPVHTARAPIEHLDELVEAYPYVCIGGMVGVPRTYARPAFATFLAHAKECRYHLLGTIAAQLFRASPAAYSGDSSRISRSANFGDLELYDPVHKARVLVPLRVAAKDPYPAANSEQAYKVWHTHRDLLLGYGLDPRVCLSGQALRSRKNRLMALRAAILSLAARAAELQGERDADHPRFYAAVGSPWMLVAACHAARYWREQHHQEVPA